MKINKKIGNLTLLVEFHEADTNEFPGDFFAHIPKKSVEIFVRNYKDSEVQECLDATDEESYVVFSNADCLIKLLCGLSELPPITLYIEYFGNPYWFFHDLQHIRNDAETVLPGLDDNRKSVTLYIEADREETALIDGAIEAKDSGVALKHIIRALMSIEKEFKERWQYETLMMDEFLERIS